MKEGIYHGRLACDGSGNLLASDAGDWPVAYHDGSFIFIGIGEPSHNARHEQNLVEVAATVAADQVPDNPELVNVTDTDNLHHFEVQPDDPHFEGVQTNPDSIAPLATGHTDAYTE
jgi:hypothetical protein